jgi:hypothetical protein
MLARYRELFAHVPPRCRDPFPWSSKKRRHSVHVRFVFKGRGAVRSSHVAVVFANIAMRRAMKEYHIRKPVMTQFGRHRIKRPLGSVRQRSTASLHEGREVQTAHGVH